MVRYIKSTSTPAAASSSSSTTCRCVAKWCVTMSTSGYYQVMASLDRHRADINNNDEKGGTSSPEQRCCESSVSLSVDGEAIQQWKNRKELFCQKCIVFLSRDVEHIFELEYSNKEVDDSGSSSSDSNVKEMMILSCFLDVRLAYPQFGFGDYGQSILLKKNESVGLLGRKDDNDQGTTTPVITLGTSPSGRYVVDFDGNTGDLIVKDALCRSNKEHATVVWKADWNNRKEKKAAPASTTNQFFKLCMQGDGNLLLRRYDKDDKRSTVVWKTSTQGNPGACFVVTDAGQVQVVMGVAADACCSPLYLDGLPFSHEHYRHMQVRDDRDHVRLLIPSSLSNQEEEKEEGLDHLSQQQNTPHFPVRGIFYYPWYPTTWTVDKKLAHHIPAKLGQYDSGHLQVIETHVTKLMYANIELGIASWWGPDTKCDRARLLKLMDVSYALSTRQQQRPPLRWCIYFEYPQPEIDSAAGIRRKLQYLEKWFTPHPSYMHIDGKPVVFVYNLKSDCSTVQQWMEAANEEWYVCLKWFSGWNKCPHQPQSWHQYGPSKPYHYGKDHFVNLSPGFWQAKEETPRLERLTFEQWTTNVHQMASQRDVTWHLITSFNEAGEGTLIEPCEKWDTTDTGMGYYLDVLHDINTW